MLLMLAFFLACACAFVGALRISPSMSSSTITRSTVVPRTVVSSSSNVPRNSDVKFNGEVYFVWDSSSPNGRVRIQAIKGAVASLLPKVRCSVVSCFSDGAELTLPLTASIQTASRKLLHVNGKGALGSVAQGLMMTIDAMKANMGGGKNSKGELMDVTVIILADGKAHGLRTATSDCDKADALICDDDLLDTAIEMTLALDGLRKQGRNVKIAVVDTEVQADAAEWSAEGALLATALAADYYHAPVLSDAELCNILEDVQKARI